MKPNPSYIPGLGWYKNKAAHFFIIQTKKEAEIVHKRATQIIDSKKKVEFMRQNNYKEHISQIEHKIWITKNEQEKKTALLFAWR